MIWPPTPSQRGFALLEVILATLIFSVAGAALATGLDRLCQTHVDARRLVGVRQEIASQLDEARVSPLASRKATHIIDGVSYVEEIAPLPLQDDDHTTLLGLWKVTISAHWKNRGESEEEYGQIYVFQP